MAGIVPILEKGYQFDMDVNEILGEDPLIAVVGASRNRAKFGNIIYRDLREKGYRVAAVNPETSEVEGDPCWRDLSSLPEMPTLVVIVTPPLISRGLVEECGRLGIGKIWLQPGASDESVRSVLAAGDFTFVDGPCIMREAPGRGK